MGKKLSVSGVRGHAHPQWRNQGGGRAPPKRAPTGKTASVGEQRIFFRGLLSHRGP